MSNVLARGFRDDFTRRRLGDVCNLEFDSRGGLLGITMPARCAAEFRPDYQAVRLPYAGENLAMVVFLPTRDSSLADLAGKLTGDTWPGSP
jgi:hypothetical protein